MRSIIFIVITFFIIFSCNISDSYEKLPFGGYEIDFEGGSQNRLLKNNELIIDSGLVDCMYNDVYMLVSVDTTYSMNPEKKDKKNLKYFIQDLKKDTIIKKISYKDLKKIIKEKSLKNIDITN
ncbi:hypothetical protein ACM40_02270 [Chryseobacterium sp. BLS98]|uniref:hypothetical protein n=1 Tax=Chryseobacterium sp. BLS98 TaxID=885586 RepID=UPI00065AAB37|nr:hypothetical protein [Chryseobacterium sp. BLS98]KMQ63645.1 hypothetical protein ACM40_02270 [Chryseobacterium sp. BLS98]